MEIILGKTAGFCGGVVRSVTEAKKVLDKYKKVYCLGELVHNKQVVESLESIGLVTVNSLDDVLSGSRVILRAHGVPKDIYIEAEKRNIELIDLTCPKVLKVHDEAKKLEKEGYYIIVAGKRTHPEVLGTISYCGVNSCIIEDVEDLTDVIKDIKHSKLNKVALISQTTYSTKKFEQIEKELKQELKEYDLCIKNTICPATEMRQKETEELVSLVDAMIIIGGKNSSNTNKLYEIAKNVCDDTYIIETAEDLSQDFSKYGKVGVMAGASTPKSSIDAVIRKLRD